MFFWRFCLSAAAVCALVGMAAVADDTVSTRGSLVDIEICLSFWQGGLETRAATKCLP